MLLLQRKFPLTIEKLVYVPQLVDYILCFVFIFELVDLYYDFLLRYRVLLLVFICIARGIRRCDLRHPGLFLLLNVALGWALGTDFFILSVGSIGLLTDS